MFLIYLLIVKQPAYSSHCLVYLCSLMEGGIKISTGEMDIGAVDRLGKIQLIKILKQYI